MFEDAVNMPQDFESLKLSLRLECARLLDWGDLAGLADHNNHPKFDRKLKANRVTIMALLSEMKTVIDRIRKVSLRSEDVLIPLPGSRAASQGITTAKELNLANRREDLKDSDMELFRSVLEPSEGQPRYQSKSLLSRGWKHVIDIGHGAANIAKQPGRIRWVVKDKDALEAEVTRLKQLTDYLHETLGDHQMSILIEQTKETCMAMLQMTRSMTEMKELVKAVEIATSRSRIESEIRPWMPLGDTVFGQTAPEKWSDSGATISGHPQTLFAQLTRFRYNVARLEAKTPDNVIKPTDYSGLNGLKLKGKQLENLTLHHTRAIGDYRVPATYMGRAAWVEWKTYHSVRHEDAPGKFHYGPGTLVTANLERLVAILHMNDRPTQFHVPLCAGYYDDEESQRFGLIYRMPDAAPQADEATTLSQLLRQQWDKAPPALQSRISLAKELATSLYFLHAVNWLHKGLRNESILVLMRDGIPDYSKPYISGFEYSRPDEKELTSTENAEAWAVYVHPHYLGADKPGYRKTYDMYSMGIILLEIAYWKPAEQILGFRQPTKPTQGEDTCKLVGGKNEPPAKRNAAFGRKQTPAGKNNEFQEKRRVAAEKQEAAQEDKDESPGKTYSKESLDDLRYIRKRLLTNEPGLLEHVSATMGSRYRDAVRACIGGLEHFNLGTDADETHDVNDTLLQQAYLQFVVDALQGIRV